MDILEEVFGKEWMEKNKPQKIDHKKLESINLLDGSAIDMLQKLEQFEKNRSKVGQRILGQKLSWLEDIKTEFSKVDTSLTKIITEEGDKLDNDASSLVSELEEPHDDADIDAMLEKCHDTLKGIWDMIETCEADVLSRHHHEALKSDFLEKLLKEMNDISDSFDEVQDDIADDGKLGHPNLNKLLTELETDCAVMEIDIEKLYNMETELEELESELDEIKSCFDSVAFRRDSITEAYRMVNNAYGYMNETLEVMDFAHNRGAQRRAAQANKNVWTLPEHNIHQGAYFPPLWGDRTNPGR